MAPACKREGSSRRRAARPLKGEGRRGRRRRPRGHGRPRGRPRLHARDDHALRRPREGRGPPAGAWAPATRSRATLVVPDSRYWLEDLVVVKKGASRTPPRGRAPTSRTPGDAMPDVALVDQDARALRLADYRGKAVALTFVFTRCPLPDFCPLMMKKFAAAHARAARAIRAWPPARVSLTISFDPAHDTPEVLRAFGSRSRRRRRPSPTGRSATGQGRGDPGAGWRARARLRGGEPARSPTTSAPRSSTARGSSAGCFRGSDWTPEELVAELRAAAGA
ncbi:MAG: SCO family protein [Candidatus Moduliflexus flocculans]|nr:SCO family protein [Candidatus Moduliflexus flocculans]